MGASAPKRRRRTSLFVVAGLLILGGVTAGGLSWFNANQASQQAQSKASEIQRVKDDAAAKKKAESDAYWAKTYAEEQQRKADASSQAAAAAATASDLAAKGWKEAATNIYTADIPGGYTCTRISCSKFMVMTTTPGGCPNGILIRGRWLQGSVVTGPVSEITGPLRGGEQAAVEVLDYTGSADKLDLTEYRCT